MKLILWISIIIGVAMLPLGCGRKEDNHGKEKVESGHSDEESPSGATFKAGKGITLSEETSKILGLEIVDVTEELLPEVVQLNIQIFTETHRFADFDIDHTGCQFHGSGFLPSDKVALVKPKQPVKFKTSRGEMRDGFVVAVQKPLTHGEIEIIVGVTTVDSNLKDGEFVSATISVPRNKPVTVIPSSALLRTAEGTYVYAVNGDAYYRTAVTAGGSADEKIEITDGLYAGDQVVVKPVETLWIIELRATKGGGHSH
ncbi:MAG: efflux RND transporter periplasmic adaptor subunit [Candidatus Omnitrophota bacterium]|nr:efflux RND transporter periplasmic adaptor subunit [Candidatus Omnitrophota bacterium]